MRACVCVCVIPGSGNAAWCKGAFTGASAFSLTPIGLFYSNFLILTPFFSKVLIEKYGKTPNCSGKQHFYSYFQNPSENMGHVCFSGQILNVWLLSNTKIISDYTLL